MMGWACDRDGAKEKFSWEASWKMTTWKTKKYMMG
jgi:hypothetical protein